MSVFDPEKPTVVYQQLGPKTARHARSALRKGYQVAAVKLDLNWDEPWENLESAWPRFFVDGQAFPTDLVLRVVEVLFEQQVAPSLFRRWSKALYESESIDFYYRRSILEELKPFLSLVWLMSLSRWRGSGVVEVGPDWANRDVLDLFLVPEVVLKLKQVLPPEFHQALCRLKRGPYRWRERGFQYVGGIVAMLLGRLRLWTSGKAVPSLWLRTYSDDWSLFSGDSARLRGVDFIVDGEELSPSDLTVWIERGRRSHHQRAYFQGRGYHVREERDITYSLQAFIAHVVPPLFRFVRLWWPLTGSGGWWRRHISLLLYYYVIWSQISRRYRPRVLLTYNDLAQKGVARNVLLRRTGCQTVFYQHSSNAVFNPEGKWGTNLVYPYLVFDTIVTWGPDHSTLFRAHPIDVRRFWEVGCLWSEHVRLIREVANLNEKHFNILLKHVPNLVRDQRRVAVFETSNWLMLSETDQVSFFNGIADLAEVWPNVFFLCKPKFTSLYKQIFQPQGELGDRVWHRLQSCANVALLPNSIETASVIALSGVTISACFSSTTLEALGAGCPAVYFDPTNRFPDVFWSKVPGMVCRSSDELRLRVDDLFESGARFQKFLRERWAGVEGFFDGRAIGRLRQRIRTEAGYLKKGKGLES